MLDYLTSQGFTVHLSRDLVVLERDGLIREFASLKMAKIGAEVLFPNRSELEEKMRIYGFA